MKQFGLPLLTKELIEQSTRKRTYVARFLFAIVLYAAAIYFFQDLRLWNSGFEILGKGRDLFRTLALSEFAAIYVFLPAMMCGVLTSEKERDTLALLLITKLGPWTIIIEKFLSRLIAMGTFGLIAMPLMAIAYSVGGIEASDIAKLMWLLAVTAFQVGSFAILCSAWFRSTGSAFLATYLLGPLWIVVSGILIQIHQDWIALLMRGWLSSPMTSWLFAFQSATSYFLAIGPAIFNGGELLRDFQIGFGLRNQQSFLDCVIMSLPIIVFALINLALARLVLWKRAFLRPVSPLMRLFQTLDRIFERVNNNWLTAGVEFFRESVVLPEDRPIRWRETSKRPLGTVRYLIRVLLVLEIPLLFMIVVICSAAEYRHVIWCFQLFEISLWCAAIAVLMIQSTGLIAVERSRQTLDVLLTTPLSDDEIIRQKLAGVYRMLAVLLIPFATLYFFKTWRETWADAAGYYGHRNSFDKPLFEFLRAILAVGMYLPTLACLGFQLSFRSRSQLQAVLSTLAILTGICLVPILISDNLSAATSPFLIPTPSNNDISMVTLFWSGLRWISPVAVLTATPVHLASWAFLIQHFALVAAVWYLLEQNTRYAFSECVGRGSTDRDKYDLLLLLGLKHDRTRFNRNASGSTDRDASSSTIQDVRQ